MKTIQQVGDGFIHCPDSAWGADAFVGDPAIGSDLDFDQHPGFAAAQPVGVGRYPHTFDHHRHLHIIAAVAALTSGGIVSGFAVGTAGTAPSGRCAAGIGAFVALPVGIAPRFSRRFGFGRQPPFGHAGLLDALDFGPCCRLGQIFIDNRFGQRALGDLGLRYR